MKPPNLKKLNNSSFKCPINYQHLIKFHLKYHKPIDKNNQYKIQSHLKNKQKINLEILKDNLKQQKINHLNFKGILLNMIMLFNLHD